MENESTYSDSYLTVEHMIQRGELNFPELDHVLEVLRQQENITDGEQQRLRDLARASQTLKPSAR